MESNPELKKYSLPTPERETAIRKQALAHVENQWRSLTPHALENFLAASFRLSRKESKQILKSLVLNGQLAYRDRHGRTVIEKSFDRAVRVSRRIVLKPMEAPFIPEPDDVVIQLRHGASFGTGSHPTTRMALRGIEYALKDIGFERKGETIALDIGTGSGVLAIAAIGMGIDRAVGLDIDSCAVKEAMENARINGIETRFEARNMDLEKMDGSVDLILANLRLPTLSRIFPHLIRLAHPEGAMVISGIQTDETAEFVEMADRYGFEPRWSEAEKGWAALVLLRRRAYFAEPAA